MSSIIRYLAKPINSFTVFLHPKYGTMTIPGMRHMQALNRELQAAEEKMEELLVGTKELREMREARMMRKSMDEAAKTRAANQ
jgi:phage-related tail protein